MAELNVETLRTDVKKPVSGKTIVTVSVAGVMGNGWCGKQVVDD